MAESFASSSTQTGPGFRPPTASPPKARPRVLIHTLGCKVNQVESDDLAESLSQAGCDVANSGPADVVVVNTCTVTHVSDKKARKAKRRLERREAAQSPETVASDDASAELDASEGEEMAEEALATTEMAGSHEPATPTEEPEHGRTV